MSDDNNTTPVRLRGGADLVEAVPYLMSFRPSESIVLIGFENVGGRHRVGPTLRIDIPLFSFLIAPSVGEYLAENMTRAVANGPGDVPHVLSGVAVVTVSDHPVMPDVIDSLVSIAPLLGVELIAHIHTDGFTPGSTWICRCPDGCGGTLPDRTPPVAVARALAGAPTPADSREAWEQAGKPGDYPMPS